MSETLDASLTVPWLLCQQTDAGADQQVPETDEQVEDRVWGETKRGWEIQGAAESLITPAGPVEPAPVSPRGARVSGAVNRSTDMISDAPTNAVKH